MADGTIIKPSIFIVSPGAIFLAESLAENKALLRLELRKNEIGPAGLMAFMLVPCRQSIINHRIGIV